MRYKHVILYNLNIYWKFVLNKVRHKYSEIAIFLVLSWSHFIQSKFKFFLIYLLHNNIFKYKFYIYFNLYN